MASKEAKVLCETPTPGKAGTRIPQWKYDAVRAAIRKAVPRSEKGIESRELPGLVEAALSADARRDLGSVGWHTVTVKLHMEVVGELARIAGARPQRIRLVR